MSIHFNQESRIFHIQTERSSYIFCVSDEEMLEHLYYGKKVRDDNVKHISNRQIYGHLAHESRTTRAFSTSVVGLECSPFNSGDLRTPSLAYDYDSNLDCNRLRYKSHAIYKGRKVIEGLPYSRENEKTNACNNLPCGAYKRCFEESTKNHFFEDNIPSPTFGRCNPLLLHTSKYFHSLFCRYGSTRFG